jgi:hypothetical protein
MNKMSQIQRRVLVEGIAQVTKAAVDLAYLETDFKALREFALAAAAKPVVQSMDLQEIVRRLQAINIDVVSKGLTSALEWLTALETSNEN